MYFQLHQQWNFFYLGFKLLGFFYFWDCRFGKDQRSQFSNHTFLKNFPVAVLGTVKWGDFGQLSCSQREVVLGNFVLIMAQSVAKGVYRKL